LLVTALMTAVGAGVTIPASAAEVAHVIPAPAADERAASGVQATSETAVLAGGCFWGVQGVFEHVSGVSSAVSGYAGGEKSTAHYEMVGSGGTGHAESVRITFDPRKNEAVDELGLKVGDRASAVIKASDVMIGK
jgi:peptide-methionine (S)-S-oxide reductase